MIKTNGSSEAVRQGYTEFPCDVCGGDAAVEVPYARAYTGGQQIHICKRCGFVYVKRRRSFAKVAEVWSKDLFAKKYTARSPLMLARHHYVAAFIDQTIGLRRKRICDIGAGEGQFLDIVRKEYSAEPFGIEPSQANCTLMRKARIPCFRGTLEECVSQPRDTRDFDIATMMWTLETGTSSRALVRGAHRLLRAGGHLVVATGSRILVPFAKPLHHYLSTNPVDTHPSRFSVRTLSSLLGQNGFRVREVNSFLNDNLTLCVVARKVRMGHPARILKDDYREVKEFFIRWHKDTRRYR